MKRPLLVAAVFLAAGIICGRYFYQAIGLLPLTGGFFALAFLLFLKSKDRAVLIFPVLAILGFFLVQNSICDEYGYLTEIAKDGGNVTIHGVVTDVSKTSANRTKIIVKTSKIEHGEKTYSVGINILAYLDFGQKVDLGTKITAGGKLSELRFKRNPGGYDEFIYLRARKIQYTIFPTEYVENGRAFMPLGFLNSARQKLAGVYDKLFPKAEAEILTAMIAGDKTGLDQETKDLFQDAGIYHILAVSGLHVGLIAAFLIKLLSILRVPEKAAAVAVLIFLALYCIMTGAGVGTVRSVTMSGVYLIGIILHKRSDFLTSCAFTAICLLLYEPLYLWDIGFQYSFAAVFGLALGTKPIETLLAIISTKLPKLGKILDGKYLKKYLSGTLAATVATMPVAMFSYYDMPLVGILANLIIVPTVFFVIATGFLTGFIGIFSISAAKVFAGLPYAALKIYRFICQVLVKIPFAKILTGRPQLYIILAFYAVLLVFVYVMNRINIKTKPKANRKYAAVLGISAALFCVLLVSAALSPEKIKVALLDVGQGDGIVISKGNKAFAIDGGGRSLEKLGSDTGTWVLLPYMNYQAVQELDAAFVTHSDADHAIGIIEAIQAGRVKRLFISREADGEHEIYDALIKSAAKYGAEITYIKAGDRIVLWDEVIVDCLYPEKGFTGSGNGSSLVLRITAGESSFLFTGDIEAVSEREILSIYEAYVLRADVLKLSHHGSKTSNLQDFINAVSPKIAVVSTGYRNSYGHPSAVVVDRLNTMGIPLINTGTEGAVTLTPSGGSIKIHTMAGEADERTKRTLKIW